MTELLVVLAVLVAGGAVAAVSARVPRLAALGVIVVLLGAPYVADPMPSTPALAARLLGAVLAGYAVWVALRAAPARTSGWRPGWPGSSAVALAALGAGWLVADAAGLALGGTGLEGPTAAGAAAGLAAGSPVAHAALGCVLAMSALAAGPVLLSRDVLRIGMGLLVLLAAAGMLSSVLTSAADDALQVALAFLTAGAGAGVAALVARSLAAHGDFELRPPTRRDAVVRTRSVDEAHPLERRR